MKIDDELLDRIATLSKLRFEDVEREQIRQDMQRMLDFVDKLSEVDTTGVEPLIHMTDEINRLREDQVTSETSQEEILRNAPSKDAYYFKVPKVIQS
ncbi:MAG: Asp-tRNA(Asn)/Glu-tRNA(Gln) amidotransferase subunit GatC [Flavobacteriales bacterium]|nr:Asp-tRNA(Asn)/Glu-tRNA(Gln) amidotransferase subunit GatC [Flavobacteriales bacterium]